MAGLFCILLKPSHHLITAEGVFSATYADGRSINASAGLSNEVAAMVDRALVVTAAFDEAVCFCENATEKQLWQAEQTVKQLGFTPLFGGTTGCAPGGSQVRRPCLAQRGRCGSQGFRRLFCSDCGLLKQ